MALRTLGASAALEFLGWPACSKGVPLLLLVLFAPGPRLPASPSEEPAGKPGSTPGRPVAERPGVRGVARWLVLLL